MPKKFIRRYLPDPGALRQYRVLRPVSRWLQDPELWHLHRRSVAGAAFIGLFCAFLPMPFQMLPAAFLAILSRCNLPVALVLVWTTNPLTMPPLMYFAYRVGAWLLGEQVAVSTIELSWSWLTSNMGHIGYPLLFGSLICGWVAGATGMILVRVLWRLHVVTHWRQRRERRRLRAAQ